MKKFFVLWSGQAVSMFGSSVVGFALAWYLAQKTHSATILSTAMLASFLPQIVLGPFIGPFIDRWNRKKIMIFGDLATALLTLALVVLFYTNTIQIWHIYVLMAGRSVSGSFQNPAFNASLPMIVPEKHLVRANGLNMTVNGLINIVGPAAGAFLMQALPIQWVLAVDIITAVPFVAFLLPLGIPQPPSTTLTGKMNFITDMVQGFRYVAAWRGLLYLLILISLMNFFAAPTFTLLPLFVTNYLGGDVLKLGWLGTAMGVGVISSGLVLGVWGGFKRRVYTLFLGLMVWSTPFIIFSFTTEILFYMGLVAWAVSGMGVALFNALTGTLIQATVEKDMQGRVFTLMGSMAGASIPLVLVLAGPVAGVVGLRAIYFIAGVAMLVLVIIGLFSKDLMNIENQKTVEKPAEEAPPLIP